MSDLLDSDVSFLVHAAARYIPAEKNMMFSAADFGGAGTNYTHASAHANSEQWKGVLRARLGRLTFEHVLWWLEASAAAIDNFISTLKCVNTFAAGRC